MKPDWDSLSLEFEASKDVVIGDVDCTVEKDLCSEYGVQGYPTIKYFTPETDPKGDSYNGGRELDALRTFTEEKLGSAAGCDPATGEACDDREKAFVEKMKAKSADDLAKQLARLEGMSGKKMAPDLAKWVRARTSILKSMTEDKDEL
jgi:thioredoxin-like negative regulator of GroEL